MCETGDQRSALSNDQAYGAELRQNYGTDFSEAQGIFNTLNGNLESVIAKGPNGNINTQETTAENSQAVENAAASNKNINASIREKGALSGAAPGVESGATQGAIANSEAKVENNLSNEEAGITENAAKESRQVYDTAVTNEEKLPAATMDPVSESSAQINEADKQTADEANYNAKIPTVTSTLLGLGGSIAGAGVKAATGALFGV